LIIGPIPPQSVTVYKYRLAGYAFDAMIRRRATHDPLQSNAQQRSVTVRTFSGGLLEARRLEPGDVTVMQLRQGRAAIACAAGVVSISSG
jgi:hypothetical protein